MKRIIVSELSVNDEKRIVVSRYDDFTLERISVSSTEDSILENIYVGKIKNIVKNINAAFVEIENGTMCYLELGKTNLETPLRIGDEIIVQVVKEAQQSKAPVVTTNFGLKHNHIILTHNNTTLGISNKIKDIECRNKLKKLFEDYINDEYGFVIRTSAIHVSDDVLTDEINELIEEYHHIIHKGQYTKCFSCVKSNPSTFICDIKEMLNKNVEEIVIEDDNLYEAVVKASSYIGNTDINIRHFKDVTITLTKLYSVENQIANLLKSKVWLKSGANIVIEHTEALTVIDVNTSKSIKVKGDKSATIFKINKEAAKEIALQISLRNIGGIILIDFIDMSDCKDKDELLKFLQNCLDLDYVNASVVDITKLNLVEVTRKKVKQPLSKQLGCLMFDSLIRRMK